MHLIKKEFRFEAAHRLLHHVGKCNNLHGHSYRVVVWIGGDLQVGGPADGMILDFGKLSSTLGAAVVDLFDHATVLEHYDPLIPVLSAEGVRVVSMSWAPTAEVMAEHIANMAAAHSLNAIRVEVWETEKAAAVWER